LESSRGCLRILVRPPSLSRVQVPSIGTMAVEQQNVVAAAPLEIEAPSSDNVQSVDNVKSVETAEICPEKRSPALLETAGSFDVEKRPDEDELSATASTVDTSGPRSEVEDPQPLSAPGVVPEAPKSRRVSAKALAASAVFVEVIEGGVKSEYAGQVTAISMETFGEIAMITRKGENVAVLLLEGAVVAYASYVVRAQLGSLNVNKVAVLGSRRRQGLGRCVMKHLIQLGKRPASKSKKAATAALDVICLSSLPTAIAFYKALGFREEPAVKLPDEEGEELIEGQMYMEYMLRRRKSR